MPNGIQLTIPHSSASTGEASPESTAESDSEPTVEAAPEATAAPSPEPTAEPTPEPTVVPTTALTTEAAAAPDAEPNATPTPTPAPLPSAEILAEADGFTAYAVVKVLFPCEQAEDLSGLQVYNTDWQKMNPYVDPVTMLPYYDTYYLAPGIYAYSFTDENGQFEAIDYTPFLVEWDKPEQKFDLVLTPAAPVMDQITDIEVHSVTMVNPLPSGQSADSPCRERC